MRRRRWSERRSKRVYKYWALYSSKQLYEIGAILSRFMVLGKVSNLTESTESINGTALKSNLSASKYHSCKILPPGEHYSSVRVYHYAPVCHDILFLNVSISLAGTQREGVSSFPVRHFLTALTTSPKSIGLYHLTIAFTIQQAPDRMSHLSLTEISK